VYILFYSILYIYIYKHNIIYLHKQRYYVVVSLTLHLYTLLLSVVQPLFTLCMFIVRINCFYMLCFIPIFLLSLFNVSVLIHSLA